MPGWTEFVLTVASALPTYRLSGTSATRFLSPFPALPSLLKVEIEKFNASMRDVNSGDTIALDFYHDRVDVLINATNVVSIKGNAFQQAALSIWLGPKPPNEDLKAGILEG